jgi:hypothetical protein
LAWFRAIPANTTPTAARAIIAISIEKCYVACDFHQWFYRPGTVYRMVAEADGNRTRQGPFRPLTGFEDRGTHQASGRLQVADRA